jgi:hypothetical protein
VKTVVYQSYRRTEVPGWIARCMQTVEHWAALKGFDYVFIDDRLFDYVPSWYREKVRGQVQIVSDLARLELAKELLASGYERTIWADADLVVFDAERFDITVQEEYAFCREIWLEKPAVLRALRCALTSLSWPKRVQSKFRVNNAVTVFTKANSMLDFYIHACKLLVKNGHGEIPKQEVGTFFLTKLYKSLHFPLLTEVALFSPLVMHDIADGRGDYTRLYIEEFGFPVRAANLCASYSGEKYNGLSMSDRLYGLVLDRLIETRGAVVNGYLDSNKIERAVLYPRQQKLSER